MNKITVKVSLAINRSPEVIWDYTQDYSRRVEWDRSVLHAVVVSEQPRRVKIKGKGGLQTELLYKLYERPKRTSLQMVNTTSAFIEGGGGSWEYAADGTGTLWTQTNTLVLKSNFLARLMRPLIAWLLKVNTAKAMKTAKRIIEGG